MHLGDQALAGGMDLHPREGQPVKKVGHVRQPAAQPVDRLRYHHVEALRLGVDKQLLESWTEAAGTTDGGVVVCLAQLPTLALDIPAAHLNLVGNRCLPLMLGAVTGINDGAEGHRIASGV